MKVLVRRILIVFAAMVLLGGAAHAQLQQRPIIFTVPFPAGGAGDVTVRLVAQRMQERFGHTTAVENKPGANGAIGTRQVIRAKPDGHSLVLATPGQISIAPLLSKDIGFDTLRDLTPVVGLTVQPLFLAIPASLPVGNVRDLVQLEKTTNIKVSFGSSGNGAMSHLLGTLIKGAGGGTFVHVPYNGGAPLLNALLAGDVQFAFVAAADAVRYGKSGKIKLLAVTGSTRWPQMPDIATFKELGYEGLGYTFWLGLLGPAGMPRPVLEQLQSEITEILTEPDTRARIEQLSMLPWPVTAEQFSATIRSELASYPSAIKASGLKAE